LRSGGTRRDLLRWHRWLQAALRPGAAVRRVAGAGTRRDTAAGNDGRGVAAAAEFPPPRWPGGAARAAWRRTAGACNHVRGQAPQFGGVALGEERGGIDAVGVPAAAARPCGAAEWGQVLSALLFITRGFINTNRSSEAGAPEKSPLILDGLHRQLSRLLGIINDIGAAGGEMVQPLAMSRSESL
jgi:hypothetical protein